MDRSASTRTLSRPARLENLGAFLDFVDRHCRQARVDPETWHSLRLVVEEVCMNLIKHGYRDIPAGPIGIEFREDGDDLVVVIADRGRPFSPDDAPEPDLTLDWEDRPIGGLGWHLVKALSKRLDYISDPAQGNRLTLVMQRAHPSA